MMVSLTKQSTRYGHTGPALSALAMIVAILSGCSTTGGPIGSPAPITGPGQFSTPPKPTRPAPPPPGAPVAGTLQPQPDGLGGLLRPKSLWSAAQWHELPGWYQDRLKDWWPAWLKGCTKANAAWTAVCQQSRALGPQPDESQIRQFVQTRLQPWRVSTFEGQTQGLLTGYFEPMLDGKRQRDSRFQYPLHRAPSDLGTRKPHYTREELDTLPEGRAAVAGREIVYLADPLDVLLIQVQGSGRVRLLDEMTAQGQPKTVRLAFGGHNDQPYQSVARWLVDQGAFTLEQASWPAIKNWANQNPSRVAEMMRANPRVVFFKEEPLTDPDSGPNGSQAVPLTPGRSIAVDIDSVPLGTPVWLDATWPQPWSAQPQATAPLQRLVMAQDRGGAILGAVRADFFWGWGEEALNAAGRTKQPLSMWVLWPRENTP